MNSDELDKVRRKLAKRYGLPDDVAAVLSPATPEVMEEEAVRWAAALKTGSPVPATTESMLAAAKAAGAKRMVRLLSPDRKAPADTVDVEAIEAATNAAEVGALERRRRVHADMLRGIHPPRTSEVDLLSSVTDSRPVTDKDTVAKLVEESRERAEQPDAERGGWREVSDDD